MCWLLSPVLFLCVFSGDQKTCWDIKGDCTLAHFTVGQSVHFDHPGGFRFGQHGFRPHQAAHQCRWLMFWSWEDQAWQSGSVGGSCYQARHLALYEDDCCGMHYWCPSALRKSEQVLTEFDSHKGLDSLAFPLIDSERMQTIWRTQKWHVKCIQALPGVALNTETGTLTNGGIVLKHNRCARGSTSLEHFHLHLKRFIPGLSIKMWIKYSLFL